MNSEEEWMNSASINKETEKKKELIRNEEQMK